MVKNLSSLGALTVFLLVFSVLPVEAEEPGVAISEIAWMGTEISHNDEWIELYNNTADAINLDGWLLKSADEKLKIILKGTIPAKGFYLLERTDDNTLPGAPADQIYTGALNNNGEKLELYDNSGNLIDNVDCNNGWFAGDNTSKQTMERKSGVNVWSDRGNWATSQNPGGTPKAKNSAETTAAESENAPNPEVLQSPPEISEKQTKTGPTTDSPGGTTQQSENYPDGVVFNEIMPSPEGPDETEEWLEIFNQNDFEVELSGWQITDSAGKTGAYAFPKKTFIASKSFLVLNRQTAKIVLNNDADGLSLISPDGKITDSLSYEKAPRGQSYNRTSSGWVWSENPTPGVVNSAPVKESLTNNDFQKKEPSQSQELTIKKAMAGVSENLPRTGFLPAAAIALLTAALSVFLILTLKRKIRGHSSVS